MLRQLPRCSHGGAEEVLLPSVVSRKSGLITASVRTVLEPRISDSLAVAYPRIAAAAVSAASEAVCHHEGRQQQQQQ